MNILQGFRFRRFGGEYEIRTRDLLHAMQALKPAELIPRLRDKDSEFFEMPNNHVEEFVIFSLLHSGEYAGGGCPALSRCRQSESGVRRLRRIRRQTGGAEPLPARCGVRLHRVFSRWSGRGVSLC